MTEDVKTFLEWCAKEAVDLRPDGTNGYPWAMYLLIVSEWAQKLLAGNGEIQR